MGIVQDGINGYLATVVPADAGAIQKAETALAFHAGAFFMFSLLAIDGASRTEAQGMALVLAIHQEFEDRHAALFSKIKKGASQ